MTFPRSTVMRRVVFFSAQQADWPDGDPKSWRWYYLTNEATWYEISSHQNVPAGSSRTQLDLPPPSGDRPRPTALKTYLVHARLFHPAQLLSDSCIINHRIHLLVFFFGFVLILF